MRWLYTVLFYLFIPAIIVRLLWRSLKAPDYRKRWIERFGFSGATTLENSLWVHAVSVGETIAAVPLIRELHEQYPDNPIVVTGMTPTGAERVQALLGDIVIHQYAPYDLPGAIKRFIKRFDPQLLVIMETELWPNMLHAVHKSGIPIVLANARLSEKSLKGYQRFMALSAPALGCINTVAAQAGADAQRFLSLGLSVGSVVTTGNIKFDIELSDEVRQKTVAIRRRWETLENRKVWIAASTHEGEEKIILSAFADLLTQYPTLLLVLVPRHPERFQPVAELISDRGLLYQRHSDGVPCDTKTQVILGDTMGELLSLYGAADIAFVGGSLVENGGHNLLEPAVWELPILSGPSLFNFAEIKQLLLDAQALTICDTDSLAIEVNQLLESEELRQSKGKAATHVVSQNRGALDRLLKIINLHLDR